MWVDCKEYQVGEYDRLYRKVEIPNYYISNLTKDKRLKDGLKDLSPNIARKFLEYYYRLPTQAIDVHLPYDRLNSINIIEIAESLIGKEFIYKPRGDELKNPVKLIPLNKRLAITDNSTYELEKGSMYALADDSYTLMLLNQLIIHHSDSIKLYYRRNDPKQYVKIKNKILDNFILFNDIKRYMYKVEVSRFLKKEYIDYIEPAEPCVSLYEDFTPNNHLKFPDNIRNLKSELCYCIYLDGFWHKVFKELFRSVSYNLIPRDFFDLMNSKHSYHIYKVLEAIELMEGDIEYFKTPLSNDTEYAIMHDWIDYSGGSHCFTHYTAEFEEGVIYRVKIDQHTRAIINNLKFAYSKAFNFHFDREHYYFTPIEDIECKLYVDKISGIKEGLEPYMCSYIDEEYKYLKPKYVYRLINIDGYKELFESTKESYYNYKLVEFDKKYWNLLDKGFSKEVIKHLISASGVDGKRNLDKCVSCSVIQDEFVYNFDIKNAYRKLKYYSNTLGAYVWREYEFDKQYLHLLNTELGRIDKRLSLNEMSLVKDFEVTSLEVICLDGKPFIVYQDLTLTQMIMSSIDTMVDKSIGEIEQEFKEHYYRLNDIKQEIDNVIKIEKWYCTTISEEESLRVKMDKLKTSVSDGYVRREEAKELRELAREVKAELKNNQLRELDRIGVICLNSLK